MRRTAHVVYDCDGTTNLTAESDHRLSVQMRDSGKTMIRIFDAQDRVQRSIHIRRALIVDITYDHNPAEPETKDNR
jgi:hypothetical protein